MPRSSGTARRRFDPDRVAALRDGGRTHAEIAAELGCHLKTVSRILRAAGVPPVRTRVRDDEVVERYLGGESVRQVADAIKVSENYVRRALARNGVALRSTPRYWGKRVDDDEVIGRYMAGATMQQVATEMGLTSSRVRGALIRNGVARRHAHHGNSTGGPPRKIDGERVVALYRQGLTQAAIAAELGCAPTVVSRRLREAGIPSKTSR